MLKAIKRSNAFTLIEVLVVIVIIGIVMSFALLSSGDFGASRKLRSQLEQLQIKLQYAQQQAVLLNTVLGVRIDSHHYEFLRFNDGQWRLLTKPQSLTRTVIDDGSLRFNSTWDDTNPAHPQIIFTNNADTSAFSIDLLDRAHQPRWRLSGTPDGKLQIEPITSP